MQKNSKLIISEDLKKGDSGEAVLALQNYLNQFGYFEYFDEKSDPQIDEPLNKFPFERGQFDVATEEALKAYQTKHGIDPVGKVTSQTIELINGSRCGVKDNMAFAIFGNAWTKTHLTYAIQQWTGQLSQNVIRNGLRAAFDLWSSIVPLRFTEVALAQSPDINIRFAIGDHGDGISFDGPGNILAHAFSPPPNGGDLAGDVHFDDQERWSVALPTPVSYFDLVSVAAHEIGHSLGLGHSNDPASLMYPSYMGVHRFLGADDIAGIQTLYNPEFGIFWELFYGHSATDIGIGANGSIWVIGTKPIKGGFEIFYYDGNTFKIIPGGAVRISVGPTGQPWIVNNEGKIFYLNGGVGGSWVELVGHSAVDIGVGADGSVWVIGTNSIEPGGYGIYHYENGTFREVGGAAVRICVGSTGNDPYVINKERKIFKRIGGVNGRWEEFYGDSAFDIGAGADGSVWVVGTNPVPGGFGIYKLKNGKWKMIDGGGVSIAVAQNGLPVLINSFGEIFRRKYQ